MVFAGTSKQQFGIKILYLILNLAMKKIQILILFTLLLNTIYIFFHGNLNFNDLYNPKLFLYKVKKSIYYELGIWNKNAPSSVIFNDKKRIFKKSIENGKVIINLGDKIPFSFLLNFICLWPVSKL